LPGRAPPPAPRRGGPESGDLVQQLGCQFVGRHVHLPAAEPGQVAVADLCADGDAPLDGERACPAQRQRVARVKAAGYVRAGDQAHESGVITEPPGAERLAQIGVQIDHWSA